MYLPGKIMRCGGQSPAVGTPWVLDLTNLPITGEPDPTPANSNLAPPGWYMHFIMNQYAANQYGPCTMAAYVLVGP